MNKVRNEKSFIRLSNFAVYIFFTYVNCILADGNYDVQFEANLLHFAQGPRDYHYIKYVPDIKLPQDKMSAHQI